MAFGSGRQFARAGRGEDAVAKVSGRGAAPARGPFEIMGGDLAEKLLAAGIPDLAFALFENMADGRMHAGGLGSAMQQSKNLKDAVAAARDRVTPDAPSTDPRIRQGGGGTTRGGLSGPRVPQGRKSVRQQEAARERNLDAEMEALRRRLGIEAEFANRGRSDALASIMQLFQRGGFPRSSKERSTEQVIVNNAGRHEPRTVVSTSQKDLMPMFLQTILPRLL